MRDRIAICIPTWRRPQGLRRLIESLNGLTFAPGQAPEITVVVIDNDSAAGEAEAHDTVAGGSRHKLIYVREPRRGLASVRNRALDSAPAECDFIAFIDDDEWATPEWLAAMLAVQKATGAPIVQGPVVPVFERPPAAWMTRWRFYEVGPFGEGERLREGASGNCLISCRLLRETGARFDTRFDGSGGEDTDFFSRLVVGGAVIAAAPRALAYESVPEERMSLAWALRRCFATGANHARISLKSGRPARIVERLAKGCGLVAVGAAYLVSAGLLSRCHAVRAGGLVARGLGTLSIFAGVPPLQRRYSGERADASCR